MNCFEARGCLYGCCVSGTARFDALQRAAPRLFIWEWPRVLNAPATAGGEWLHHPLQAVLNKRASATLKGHGRIDDRRGLLRLSA
jgi:hypothetical protein